MTAMTNIYEDYGFQDFTSRWIDKVTCTLMSIEDNVAGLLDFVTSARSSKSKTPKKKLAKKNNKHVIDKDLLNDPQAIDRSKSQAEIDTLLASFD